MEVQAMGGVRLLTMNELPTNSFSKSFLDVFAGALREIEADQDARVVVICSRIPGVFSSGLALQDLRKSRFQASLTLFCMVRLAYGIVKRIRGSRLLYIAALHGSVIGSAVSMAAACDFRFASESAWFWVPDPQYGGLLADGGLCCLQEWLGCGGAYRLCMTNSRINAAEAGAMGFLSLCSREEDALTDAMDCAQRLSQFAEGTLRETKRLLRNKRGLYFPWRQLIRITVSEDWRGRLQAKMRTKGNARHEAERENDYHNRRSRRYR